MSRRLINSLSALLVLAALSATAFAADPQSKTGTIKSVDDKAKSFVVDLSKGGPLTFTTDDKTTFTLDGKASTCENAVKADQKVTVTYTKVGQARLASKVEVTAVPAK